MSILKYGLLSAAGLLLAVPAAPSVAQEPAAGVNITVGATVRDTSGAEVGTVKAVQGDVVVVKTDKYEAGVPRSSFAAGANGLLLGLTRAQLNAAVEQNKPELSVGATVYDPQGGLVGTIQEVDAEFATVKLAKGAAKLPVTAFAKGPKGPMVGDTAASLEAKVAAAAGAASSGS